MLCIMPQHFNMVHMIYFTLLLCLRAQCFGSGTCMEIIERSEIPAAKEVILWRDMWPSTNALAILLKNTYNRHHSQCKGSNVENQYVRRVYLQQSRPMFPSAALTTTSFQTPTQPQPSLTLMTLNRRYHHQHRHQHHHHHHHHHPHPHRHHHHHHGLLSSKSPLLLPHHPLMSSPPPMRWPLLPSPSSSPSPSPSASPSASASDDPMRLSPPLFKRLLPPSSPLANVSPPPPLLFEWSPPISRRSPPPLPRPPPPHRYLNTTTSPPRGNNPYIAPQPPSPLPMKSHPPPSKEHISPSPPSPRTSRPPLPREGCDAIVCLPPLTKTPFMSPCGCVRPIQVKLVLSVPLYSLFPMISLLAANLAEGTVLSPNQVDIIGANADSRNPDCSIVDVNLVPLDQAFDNLTALLIFQKLWKHKLLLNVTLFGNYNVIYVRYPGLPDSTEGIPETNGNSDKNPWGVVVDRKRERMGVWVIVVIALTSAIALVACLGCFWLLFLNFRYHEVKALPSQGEPIFVRTKRSGGHDALSSDHGSSVSISFASSMPIYANSAKAFTLAELERATDKFKPENVIGEGGFGRVYCGTLDDGTRVAVKVLTRNEGGKEFIAEVEMLSRLHHRNLVKLIGICANDHNRCLVYELIPNGSVESHLHGVDKEISPLNWQTRMKIALGAARGLAYLHEDSNPRVIHRDFKASNILLENDFNPKVSDFGLARSAPDESQGHLSTRVMGTFGYVAPEYAMTGHLLVKSDVYSYGVVLLELLTGRKPVDMSQPPGQENLVTWARPLLTSEEGIKMVVDPCLGGNYPPDNLVRVAAIASMCVQPEVSQRPFMGEVVQALKLVYNDCDVPMCTRFSNVSQGGGEPLLERGITTGVLLEHHWLDRKAHYIATDTTSFISVDYDSGESGVDRPLSITGIFPNPRRFIGHHRSRLRRHSISGPEPRQSSSRSKLTRYKLRRGVGKWGSVDEHSVWATHFGMGSFDRDLPEIFP